MGGIGYDGVEKSPSRMKKGLGGELAFVGVELDADAARQGHLGDGDEQPAVRDVVHGADLGLADQGADQVAGFDLIRQVHGGRVVVVEDPAAAGARAGTEADALVTAAPGVALAVHTADCAPVALVSPEGVLGVAHAGWKGLEAGVIPAVAAAMPAWQHWAHHGTHGALYALFFAVPLLGWAYSSAAGFPIVLFGVLPLPDFMPVDKALAEALKPWHGYAAYALAALVVLHVAAALKHQFVDRDSLLTRMLPGRR